MSIFHKIPSFLKVDHQKRHSDDDRLVLQIQVRPGTLTPSLWRSIEDRIEVYRLVGYRLEVTELQEQIPVGYAGLWILKDEKKQEFREYLLIQSIFVEKKRFSFRKIDSSSPPADAPAHDNNDNPFHP